MRAKILNASAGSGKTYQLAYKYVRDVVEQPAVYRHILAVTFTNKATEEMKSRILKEIHRLAAGEKSGYLERLCGELRLSEEAVRRRAAEARARILHDYSRFTVLTIDTFFQRILRAFLKELNLDLNYNIEIETASILAKSADTLIERITTDRALLAWLTRFVEERIEEGRRWDVREGILSLGGELFKEKNKDALASARSREELAAIVRRMTERCAAAEEALRNTASEAVRRIADAGGSADDFPYKERGFVSWFYALAAGTCGPYGGRVATACAKDEAWGKPDTLSQRLRPVLQPLLCTLREAYDRLQPLRNTSTLLRETYRSFALLGDLYARVQELCDEQQLMLLSETKYLLAEFVGRNDAPFIYEKVGNRFDRFMIDEFQDTSVKEWENFLPLLQNALAQSDKETVLLVGDIKQSIYRWRGSDWRILRSGAAAALGADHVEVRNLEENWRSLPVIVRFNNAAIGRIAEADNCRLNRELDAAVAAGRLDGPTRDALHDLLADAYCDAAQRPRRRAQHEGYVSVERFDEAPPLVERICEALDRGFSPSQIMILVRSATDGARIAAELLDFKSRNTDPRYRFDVMTQEALVIGSAPVSTFVTAVMRLALNPDDSLHRALCNRYLGRPFDAPSDDEERRFFRSLRLLSPEEAFERIVLRYGLQNRPAETAYLQALHEQIIAFSTTRIADIPLFLARWDEQGSARSLSVEQSATTIEITTVHKAKGLEKPVVMIPYCAWALDPKSSGAVNNIVWAEASEGEAAAVGRFPLRFKQQMAESDFSAAYYRELVYSHIDNINLLYVALTRAAEELHVFLPARGTGHVGALLREVLCPEGESCPLGELAGRYERTERGERFQFGSCCGPEPADGASDAPETVLLTEYPTAEADLRLRLPSQRYFEEEESAELSPRNFGILMHRAFAEASNEAEIDEAVDCMVGDGLLGDDEAAELRRRIREALADPIVAGWFVGSWRQVRTESEIILPGSSSTRRPDRVMLRDGEAVVVDYKFGERDAARYRRQIGEYARLLGEMGYGRVSGYLWYVRLGRIERVV